MSSFPKLNFPPARLKVSRSAEGQLRVWDRLRKIWIVLTPEEWVRQHLIEYLIGSKDVPEMLVKQECPVCVGGMNQRADVVVYGLAGKPLLIAECKCTDIELDASVYAQAVRYNAVLGARYIVITNGIEHYVFENDGDGGYLRLKEFPRLFD